MNDIATTIRTMQDIAYKETIRAMHHSISNEQRTATMERVAKLHNAVLELIVMKGEGAE